MDLEKLFKEYQAKKVVYSNVVEFNHNGDIVNAREIAGRLGAVKKAHKKFIAAFENEKGEDLQNLIEWQQARV